LNLLAPPVKNRRSPPRPGFIYDEISDVEGVKVATPGWLLVSVSGGSWVLEICLAFLREIDVFLAILNVFQFLMGIPLEETSHAPGEKI